MTIVWPCMDDIFKERKKTLCTEIQTPHLIVNQLMVCLWELYGTVFLRSKSKVRSGEVDIHQTHV